jgi:4-diphosphocytidyl-2-C-methyl-D-erythritol kinase
MAARLSAGATSKVAPAYIEIAPAKINLTLRILGRRRDGYHEISSLVAFADIGDRVSFSPGHDLAIVVRGPLAVQAGPAEENLVIKAARALARHLPKLKVGRFILTKNLPAGAGLGGGSSDAAAALRLLARLNRIKLSDPRLHQAALATGADVPVCLDPKPRWMSGIGEILSPPLALPRLYAVLVRPDVAVPTKNVFAALNAASLARKPRTAPVKIPSDTMGLIEFITESTNDLEPPARLIAPQIGEVLEALQAEPSCLRARMSGSGSACFGIFTTRRAAAEASRGLAANNPDWWVKPTVIG